jgi:benzoyl-CoA reductase subunit D
MGLHPSPCRTIKGINALQGVLIKMITAGIDAGNKFTKAVLVKDGEIIGTGRVPSGFDQRQAAVDAFNQALSAAGLHKNDVQNIIATGTGKAEVDFAGGIITEVGAAARGAIKVFPQARTVVDVGAEEGRALKMDKTGKVINFAINEKCATGTGSFVEAMCRALEIDLEEMGPLSLQATQVVPMNSHCAVFAESEVISLIHSQIPKADIARSVHNAMANRIASMVRRVGLEKEIAMIGGVAKNPGFVRELERDLELTLLLTDKPDFISALGAALAAQEKNNPPKPKTELGDH